MEARNGEPLADFYSLPFPNDIRIKNGHVDLSGHAVAPDSYGLPMVERYLDVAQEDLTGFSTNPHWDADFKSMPTHPITRGVKPFKIRDEWYFNIRFKPEAKGVTPILKSAPPDAVRRTAAAKEHKGREETVAWAFERDDGGRSFGFTGGHTHKNWGDENFRRLVTNAILWTAKVGLPREGAKVDLDPASAEHRRQIGRRKTSIGKRKLPRHVLGFSGRLHGEAAIVLFDQPDHARRRHPVERGDHGRGDVVGPAAQDRADGLQEFHWTFIVKRLSAAR